MRAYLEGQDKSEGGIAAMTINFVPVLNSILSCPDLSDDTGTKRDVFKVRDYILDKPRNEDGSLSNNQQGARNTAMMVDLFGFETYNIPHAARTARDKALPAAIAVAHYYPDGLRVVPTIATSGAGKRNVIGGVPAADMFDLVKPDGTLTGSGKATLASFTPVFHRERKRFPKDDAELVAYMLAYPVETTGRLDPTFRNAQNNALKALSTSEFIKALTARAIADKVLPAPAAKKPKTPVDAGTDIAQSVKLVSDWVALIAADDGEPAAAPLVAHEKLIDELCERWAAYRVVNPRMLLD
jgi:hypothetical protein